MSFVIERRRLLEVCTDPLRRCYHGVFAKSELQWTAWESLETWPKTREEADERMEYFKDLNDYAVRERGQGARAEFRVVEAAS